LQVCEFRDRGEFKGETKEQWIKSLVNININNKLKLFNESCWDVYGSSPDGFLYISFEGAHFLDKADFSSRSFEESANFTNSRFYYPPIFENVTNASQIDFTGAKIGFVPPTELHWTTDSQIPVRLRALRKVAEETKNHDLERDLYIEERKAERGVYFIQRLEDLDKGPEELTKSLEVIKQQQKSTLWKRRREAVALISNLLGSSFAIGRLLGHVLWVVVMFFYWAFADYGRSFLRPAVWLISSVWLFHWGYAMVLAPLARQVGAEKATQFEQATWMLARGNAVPFVGPLTIDAKIKEFLFCAGRGTDGCVPIPPDGFQLLVIAQNVLSIALVFFIGLALRNYFKVK